MLRIGKKIKWIFKRHPFLYYVRFKLLSKNVSKEELGNYFYNTINAKHAIPKSFAVVSALALKEKREFNDFDKALALARWLRVNIKGGRGLSLSSEKALEKMLAGEGGVCSDMAQIFNNFCVVNDIKVREWGITSFPFNSEFGGHAFNEFYSESLQKWVLIDVSKTLMFYLEGSLVPLSVMELFECNKRKKPIAFKSFLETNPPDVDLINFYYLQRDRAPFLICNYHSKTYDVYLDRFMALCPVFVIHFWLYLIQKSYYYLFPLDDYKNELVYDR
ncbi:transglutaminase-like domain-containing protein [Aestuariivivens marinum]|uniref:transglutaminase-like domain-containing protein n=1 Tax=Aestuariivivens marinum TaxID=2913555 RepID=UPI001F58DA4A|nr:transglutaminase-like domain-containing protein [Aestuariivivens marinum]